MVRVAKSLLAPDQGFPHRDHRSTKNRRPNYKFSKHIKVEKTQNREAELYDQEMQSVREEWSGELF